MQSLTITAPAMPVTLPALDPNLGEQLGDEILLDVARTTKPAKVRAGQAQAEPRAWSYGGNVD